VTQVRGPQVRIHYETRIKIGKIDRPELSGVFEGELPMSDTEQDAMKALIGDGNGSVSIRRSLGEMAFGNGGNCSATVTITCDQSQAAVEAAAGWASYFAGQVAEEELAKVREQVLRLGITP